MTNVAQVQKELDILQKFALFLQIDRTPEYLAEVEDQLIQVYGSRLVEAIGRDKYEQLLANLDQLDRLLSILEQIRQVLIAEERADWRGALEENVRRLEEKRRQEIATKIAEEKIVSLAEARIKLVKTLTPLLPYADPDIVEFAADKVVLDCADQPEAALIEAIRTIDIITATTGPDIAVDPLAIAHALEPATLVLEITYPEFKETATQIAAELAVQSPAETSSAAFVYTTNLVTTAAYAGLPDAVIDISKNTQKIESLALQSLKPPQAAQVTQILTQPGLQLTQLFQLTKQEISAQFQFNKAVDKHVKLSGASQTDQKMAAEVIKRYVMPPMALVYRFAETPEEKQSLTKSAYQKFAAQIGLDLYSRGARVRMAAISQAVYFQVQSFPYTDFQSSLLHRRALTSGPQASPYMEMFFGQMQNMITDKVAKAVVSKATTSLGIKVGTQAAVTVGAEVAVEAGVVAAGAATGPPGWVVAAAAIAVGFAKDAVSKASRWVKENWPMLAGAVAGLLGGIFAGFAPVGIAAASLVGGVGGSTLTQGGISRLGSGASRFFNGIAGLAVVEIATPILIIVLTVPIVVALILFIINNSAYIVPQAVGTITGGVGPAGCPASMWPVAVNQGQQYYVSQGPGGTYTHGPPCTGVVGGCIYQEAIDINPRGVTRVSQIDPSKHLVLATHPGTVVVSGMGTDGGNRVHLVNSCGGDFRTVYVHMSVIYVAIGQILKPGDVIGVIGQTGFATYPHLHYDFRNNDGSHKNRQDPPPFMVTPYVPKTVPQYCSDRFQCNTSIP